jgi:N-acetylmuramoyl-L-alanine amidase
VSTSDAIEEFGEGTVAVVEAFQRARGLPITGVVDDTTWDLLIEAGWRLGQRLLYTSVPKLRGDDVAELQVRLAQFGFNPGRIDGIFGPLTEEALRDFQRNCAQDPSGTLTRSTLTELERLSSTRGDRSLVTEARDLAGFHVPPSGPLVIAGQSSLVDRLVRACENDFKVDVLHEENPDVVAAYANDHEAAFVLSIQTFKQIDGIHLHYWASYRSHSRRGEQLANLIASACARSTQIPRVDVTGMSLPILRETKMITLHIELGEESDAIEQELARIIGGVMGEVIHR